MSQEKKNYIITYKPKNKRKNKKKDKTELFVAATKNEVQEIRAGIEQGDPPPLLARPQK